MKNFIYTLIALGFVMNSFAQEAAEKKFQAGLMLGSGLNFQKMGTKRLATNGAGSDWTVGGNIVYNFSETIGVNTGLEFDFNKLKYKATTYESKNAYYYYNDQEILELNEVDITNTSTKLFMLNERVQKSVYLSIPTMLIFRTKFFGYYRYFGKFGLRNSFLLTSKITDEGSNLDDNDATTQLSLTDPKVKGTNENMKAPGDMLFFKSTFGVCGGAEWNFSGSTSLVAELGYYYGFTPLHNDRNTTKGNNYFFASGENNGNGDDVYFNNKASQSQLMLKISILF